MIDRLIYLIIGFLDKWVEWVNSKLNIKPKKKKKSKPSPEDLFNGE